MHAPPAHTSAADRRRRSANGDTQQHARELIVVVQKRLCFNSDSYCRRQSLSARGSAAHVRLAAVCCTTHGAAARRRSVKKTARVQALFGVRSGSGGTFMNAGSTLSESDTPAVAAEQQDVAGHAVDGGAQVDDGGRGGPCRARPLPIAASATKQRLSDERVGDRHGSDRGVGCNGQLLFGRPPLTSCATSRRGARNGTACAP